MDKYSKKVHGKNVVPLTKIVHVLQIYEGKIDTLYQDSFGKPVLLMATENSQPRKQLSSSVTSPPTSSCRRKKSENAILLEDLRDHIDEFIHASAEEHKSCFTKTTQKMFGMSKVIAERSTEAKGVETSLHLQVLV